MESLQVELGKSSEKLKKYKKYKIIIIVIGLVILFFLSFMPVRVVGESMENNIKEGDMYLVSKLEYLFKNPEYKDVVLIEAYRQNEKYYIIKRVIGVPGDNIVIEDNRVYINGKLLKEEYIKEDIKLVRERIEIDLEDEVFVMGDNRSYSKDSRNKLVGAIDVDRVVGKAFLKYYSEN